MRDYADELALGIQQMNSLTAILVRDKHTTHNYLSPKAPHDPNQKLKAHQLKDLGPDYENVTNFIFITSILYMLG